MVIDVPPDIGPSAGSIPVTFGSTTVNKDGPLATSEPTLRCTVTITSSEPGALVNAVVNKI